MIDRETEYLANKVLDRVLEKLKREDITQSSMLTVLGTIKSVRKEYTADDGVEYITQEKINEYFDKTWVIYPRKVSKILAQKTYTKKLNNLQVEEARRVANMIYRGLENQIIMWKRENGGAGRAIELIPHCSSWLNANVADAPKGKRR